MREEAACACVSQSVCVRKANRLPTQGIFCWREKCLLKHLPPWLAILSLTRTSYCDAGVAIKKFFSGKKELLPAKSGERGRRRRRGVRKEEGEWKGESTAGSERKERGRKREKEKKGCKDEAAAAPTKRDAASDGRRLATGDRVTLASPPEHDFSLSLSFPPSSVEDATA